MDSLYGSRKSGAWRLAARLVLVWTCCSVAPASAKTSIDVLWYSYAHDTSAYKKRIDEIARNAPQFPEGGGSAWSLVWFGPGDAPPDFAKFDVLVIHSAEPWMTGPAESDVRITPNYSGILRNKAAIEAARGSRTFLSGSDADFHAARGDTGHTPIFAPDHGKWDGALGHVVNAVDWAAAGTGLGIVAWYHGEDGPDAYWWLHPDSFLKTELEGYVTDFSRDLPGVGRRENTPIISEEGARDPLNRGLTSTGISDWQWSFHGGFDKAIPGYRGVIESAKYPDRFLAIARVRPSVALLLLVGVLSSIGMLALGWLVARVAKARAIDTES